MSKDEKEPDKSLSFFQRLSLTSLRRELQAQKAKTAQAREDARDRIEDGKKGKTPWGKVLALCAIGLIFTGGIVLILRSALPPMDEWSLPDFVLTPFDAGTLADFEMDEPEIDAGTDAGRERRHGPRRRRDAGHAPTKQGGLDFGDSVDPIGGLLDDD